MASSTTVANSVSTTSPWSPSSSSTNSFPASEPKSLVREKSVDSFSSIYHSNLGDALPPNLRKIITEVARSGVLRDLHWNPPSSRKRTLSFVAKSSATDAIGGDTSAAHSSSSKNAQGYDSLREAMGHALNLVLQRSFHRKGYTLSNLEKQRAGIKKDDGHLLNDAFSVFDKRRRRLLTMLLGKHLYSKMMEDKQHTTAKQLKPKETISFDGNGRNTAQDAVAVVENPPFTIQRLAEVLCTPEHYYTQTHKLCNALEKLLLVTSTSLDFGGISGGEEAQRHNDEREKALLADQIGRENQMRRIKRRLSSPPQLGSVALKDTVMTAAETSESPTVATSLLFSSESNLLENATMMHFQHSLSPHTELPPNSKMGLMDDKSAEANDVEKAALSPSSRLLVSKTPSVSSTTFNQDNSSGSKKGLAWVEPSLSFSSSKDEETSFKSLHLRVDKFGSTKNNNDNVPGEPTSTGLPSSISSLTSLKSLPETVASKSFSFGIGETSINCGSNTFSKNAIRPPKYGWKSVLTINSNNNNSPKPSCSSNENPLDSLDSNTNNSISTAVETKDNPVSPIDMPQLNASTSNLQCLSQLSTPPHASSDIAYRNDEDKAISTTFSSSYLSNSGLNDATKELATNTERYGEDVSKKNTDTDKAPNYKKASYQNNVDISPGCASSSTIPTSNVTFPARAPSHVEVSCGNQDSVEYTSRRLLSEKSLSLTSAVLEQLEASRSSTSDSESGDDGLEDDSASDSSDGSNKIATPSSGSIPFTAAKVMALNRLRREQLFSRAMTSSNSTDQFRPPPDSEYQSGDSIDSMMAEDSGGSDSSSSDIAD